MLACPLKSSPEWVSLVGILGDNLASNVYVSEDYNIPVPETSNSPLLKELYEAMDDSVEAKKAWLLTKTIEFKDWFGSNSEPSFYRDEQGRLYIQNTKGDKLFITTQALINLPPIVERANSETSEINDGTNKKGYSRLTQVFVDYNLNNEHNGARLMPMAEAIDIVQKINKNNPNVVATIIKEGENAYVTVSWNTLEESFDLPASSINYSSSPAAIPERRIYEILKEKEHRMKVLVSALGKAEAERDTYKTSVLNNKIIALQGDIDFLSNTIIAEQILESAYSDLDLLEVELNNPNITLEDLEILSTIPSVWSDRQLPFLTEDEKESETILEEFLFIRNKAEKYADKIRQKYQEIINAKIAKEKGLNLFDYARSVTTDSDINAIAANTRDISEAGDSLLSFIDGQVKSAQFDTLQELKERHKEIEELTKKVKGGLVGSYEIFWEKDNKGRYTGRLVSPYSSEYYDALDKEYLKAKGGTNGLVGFFNWKKANQLIIDPNVLVPLTGSIDETNPITANYIKYLKTHLGENGYNNLISVLQNRIQEYKELESDYIQKISATGWPQSKIDEEIKKWQLTYSPYEYAKSLRSGSPIKIGGIYINSKGWEFLPEIPLKYKTTVTNGKISINTSELTGYYNDSFSEIENNQELLDLYNLTVDSFRELGRYLSPSERARLHRNGLPMIAKLVSEKYMQDGLSLGLAPLEKEIKSFFKGYEESEVEYSYQDPITKEVKKSLRISGVGTPDNFIETYVRNVIIEFRTAEGREPTSLERSEFRKDAKHQLALDSTRDLERVLKTFTAGVVSFKHKSKVENLLHAGKAILEDTVEFQKTKQGTSTVNPNIERVAKTKSESFKNKKAMFDYYIDVFYGKTKEEAVVKNRATAALLMTKEEKTQKQKLENILEQLKEDYAEGRVDGKPYYKQSADIKAQIFALEAGLSITSIGDGLLKWTQLKGMGWNLFSAGTNMGFGYIGNYREAAAGRIFNSDQLDLAYSYTLHSIARNYMFQGKVNEVGEFFETGQIIRFLMDSFDVLKDASYELERPTPTNSVNSSLKFASPFNMQSRSEFVNQAPVMMAVMMNTPLYKLDGTKSNFWEMYLNNKGEWNEAEYGAVDNDAVFKLKRKIDKSIKRIHGNYDPNSPLMLNKKFVFRAMKQFRTWLFELVAGYVESRRFDEDLQLETTGRLRSVANLATSAFTINQRKQEYLKEASRLEKRARFEESSSNPDLKLVEQFRTDAEKAITKAEALGNTSVIGSPLEILLKLTQGVLLNYARMFTKVVTLGKVNRAQNNLFEKYSYSDGKTTFNATDMANMKSLISELTMLVNVLLMILLLRSLDDEDKDKGIIKYAFNLLLRIRTDLLFFYNPEEMMDLLGNVAPMLKNITDTSQWIEAAFKAIKGEDKIRTGVYAGDSRLTRETLQMMPMGTSVYRTYQASKNTFDK